MRFDEEMQVTTELLHEWYESMEQFTSRAAGVASTKAKQYDKVSPVWHRIEWPGGFLQELRKKTDRISQLLEVGNGQNVDWNEINEELRDIFNYARMFGAINLMIQHREVCNENG